ncbi:MAG: hypothetical protein ABIN79_00650 [Marmoricola sp.]
MPFIVSIVLLALAVVLVVLTRLRLGKSSAPGAGRVDLPMSLVNLHSVVGGIAIAVWGTYLLTDVSRVVGVVGLALWWVTTGVGLMVLARWLPARGRHASSGATDGWTEGPWLSMVAHLGALVGAITWTTFLVRGSI